MNTNELRIGNLIFSKETNEIQKITGITEDNVYFNSITFDYPCLEEIEPIELTQEFLLKFGLGWKNNGLRKSNFCVRNWGSGWIIFMSNEMFNFKIELKYVHQLQNLYFALTGTELAYEK